ncbi:MAG: L,D-transpeptidase family protein [Alphaproteobacteria bacterium]|nr:L,D-transpeptidase family protein [Alphaproteobacteria bacterium]MCW5741273.1 L,D-transpeptidase family protein [Alphaproteobacteria bacterium]
MDDLIEVIAEPRRPTRGVLRHGSLLVPCALGRGGVRADKREGDGATPLGVFPLRRLWYRADRLDAPPTDALPVRPIQREDGWCDDPDSPQYNRPVSLPHPARHERLWREDALYDLVVELGYNDGPVVPGVGSAVFLHVARADYGPTEGCVAIGRGDLLRLVAAFGPATSLRVTAMR